MRGEAGLEQPGCCLEAISLHGLGAVLLHPLEGLLEALELGVAVGVIGHTLLLLIQRFPAQQSDCVAELTCAIIYVVCKKSAECEAHMTHKFLDVQTEDKHSSKDDAFDH